MPSNLRTWLLVGAMGGSLLPFPTETAAQSVTLLSSSPELKESLPKGWEPLTFRKIKRHTVYEWSSQDRAVVSNGHPPGWVNPEPAQRYNLVVIGAGTAGLVTAAGAAGLGAKAALVEKHLKGRVSQIVRPPPP